MNSLHTDNVFKKYMYDMKDLPGLYKMKKDTENRYDADIQEVDEIDAKEDMIQEKLEENRKIDTGIKRGGTAAVIIAIIILLLLIAFGFGGYYLYKKLDAKNHPEKYMKIRDTKSIKTTNEPSQVYSSYSSYNSPMISSDEAYTVSLLKQEAAESEGVISMM